MTNKKKRSNKFHTELLDSERKLFTPLRDEINFCKIDEDKKTKMFIINSWDDLYKKFHK